jgi:hypothetical protein
MDKDCTMWTLGSFCEPSIDPDNEQTDAFSIQVRLAKKLNGNIPSIDDKAKEQVDALTPIKVTAPRSFSITNK